MSKVSTLKLLVKRKLNVAIEEVWELFEKAIAEYEEEFRRKGRKEACESEHGVEPNVGRKTQRGSQCELVNIKEEECEEPPTKKRKNAGSSGLKSSPEKASQAQEEVRKSPQGSESFDSDHGDIAKEPLKTKPKLKCSDCGQMFVHKEDLAKHKKTHTGKKPLTSAVVPTPSAKEALKTKPKLKCSECGQMFVHKEGLEKHQKTHTEKKPAVVPKPSFTSAISSQQVATKSGRPHAKDLHSATGLSKNSRDYLMSDSSDSDSDSDVSFVEPLEKTKMVHKGDLDRHTKTHIGTKSAVVAKPSGPVKSFNCSVCVKRFPSRDLLISHIRTHVKEKPAASGQHVVPESPKPDSQPDKLPPVAQPPNAEKHFTCSNCKRHFLSERFLMLHMRTHNEQKPVASGSSGHAAVPASPNLDSQPDKLRPVARPPDTVKSFTCSVCTKSFLSRDLLISHIRTHTEEKPTTSRISDQRLVSKSPNVDSQPDRLAPVAKPPDAVKSFSCSICAKNFPSSALLISHTRTHAEEKPVASGSSGQRRVSESPTLNSQPDKLPPVSKPSNADQYFTCSTCKKSFSTEHFLELHMQTHDRQKLVASGTSGQHLLSESQNIRPRPQNPAQVPDKDDVTSDSSDSDSDAKKSPETNKKLPCSECGEVFVHKADLDGHMKTHTGKQVVDSTGVTKLFYTVKSLSCSVCTKSFASEESLAAHVSVHANEKRSPSTSSTQLAPTQTNGEHGEDTQSEPESLFAPLSDSDMSDSSADDPNDNSSVSGATSKNSEGEANGSKRAGDNARRIACSFCEKTYMREHHLLRHVRSHHQGASSESKAGEGSQACDGKREPRKMKKKSKGNKKRQECIKNLKCSHCKKRFEQMSQLTQHLVSRNSCHVCDEKFCFPEEMREHIQNTH
ncbi:zinc finger protein Xfin-like isoform X2 [Syngnathus acus]|uniref:zinc finger protein Xfin-like isoform X2 n=1 Tax=Syngnathus acus TaxID=161584 RepID=UPI0018864B43|nr:zinc finger protein Xfin-like isoform X2 [Syngnathus acus]